MHVARLTAEALMRKGAYAILQSAKDSSLDHSLELPVSSMQRKNQWVYTTRHRTFPAYLPLEDTMDATLARIGQKTRFNLRYYRRRAEAGLGCSFVEDVKMDRAEFLAFNRRCSYAAEDDQAGWRYDAVAQFPGMFLSGIKGSDGDWLSIIGGRRYHNAVEIDWQMNRSDLPAYSLSTVMRAYFIEHEIAQGTKKMYIEGGTPHAMRHSFAKDQARDLVVLRRSSLLWLLRTFAKRFVPRKNFLMQLLAEEQLRWQSWAQNL